MDQFNKYPESLRYLMVAIIGLGFDFSLVIVSKEVLHLHYLIASCIGFIFGLLVTYELSNRFVFGKPKGNKNKTFFLFSIVGVVGLLILNALMYLQTGLLGVNYILAKIIATGFVFCWNFIARKSLYTQLSE